jgi:nucleoside-diphosphate-sugar epimerase
VRRSKEDERQNLEFRTYDMTKPLSPKLLAGVDYVVHAAYIKLDAKHPDALELNISGAKNLIRAAGSAKAAPRMTFISTMSAHEEAISIYGKQKLEIEKLFLKENNATVLRCGLIVGNGGIVREMAQFMKSKHAVPLIGGGNQPLQIISVHDLAKVIDNVFTRALGGRFVAATPKVYSYKSFYAALAKQLRIKIVYVPLPYWVLEGVFKAASALNISLGVGEDNLKGLKKLTSMPSQNDLKVIGVRLMELDKALAQSDIKA